MFELTLLWKCFKVSSKCSRVSKIIEEMKSYTCNKIMFNMNREQKEDILTNIVKEKGISKIIMDFCDIEDIVDERMEEIEDIKESCSDRVEGLVLQININKKLEEFLIFQRTMMLGSVLVNMEVLV